MSVLAARRVCDAAHRDARQAKDGQTSKERQEDVDKAGKSPEIGAYFEQFISTQIATGRFTSNSEVLQAGLRLLEEKEMHFHRRKAELTQVTDSAKDLSDLTPGAGVSSLSVPDAMRVLTSAVAEKQRTVTPIPATKGLLRSRVAAE